MRRKAIRVASDVDPCGSLGRAKMGKAETASTLVLGASIFTQVVMGMGPMM